MDSFGAYGLAAARQGQADPNLAALLEEVAVRGFAVVPEMLTGAEVERLNGLMDEIYARQCAEVGGEPALASMNDADLARCPLAYDEAFLELATHPTLVGLAKAMLGENVVLLMQNGVINRPDRPQFQSNWHRDLNYQHWVCSRPLAMSALVCLEDFNPQTGGTVFLPGSHLVEPFPSAGVIARSEAAPEAAKGSMIVFNSMVFHRAGVNRSTRVRRAVNHVIGVPILAQQVDIPAMLGGPAPDDPWLAGYLGYRWNPTRDVAAWRRQRIAQARARADG